jgi:hypothetical protein
MTGYRPVAERGALLDALEAELLAAPEDEVRAVLATRRTAELDQAIAAGLDEEALPGLPPLGLLPFLPVTKGH